MKTESIDYSDNKDASGNTRTKDMNPIDMKMDPTFDEGIMYIFSPEVEDAINKLTEIEWEIFAMRYGIYNGIIEKSDYIAEKLKIKKHTVDKILKRVRRLLMNNIEIKSTA